MKSSGYLAEELNEAIEFSLIACILLSDDCSTFIPCPLCPTTRNFGILNDADLFISRQDEKRVEKRVREGLSGTWSRDGTSETWTALRAIVTFLVFFFFLKRRSIILSGNFEDCCGGGVREVVGIYCGFWWPNANGTGSAIRIFLFDVICCRIFSV